MPLDSTPRIFAALSSTSMPGTQVPTGANTPFMPARAFGAPQTTWTVPSPVSTVQTRSRSASGCCSAEITWATRKAESCAARSSTVSTSRPMRISVSTISSSEASVSRWSFSQLRVNFMARPYNPRTIDGTASGTKP